MRKNVQITTIDYCDVIYHISEERKRMTKRERKWKGKENELPSEFADDKDVKSTRGNFRMQH